MKKLKDRLKNSLEVKNGGKKGITLISLIITIVIMLILAAVVLKLILGNNGLLNKVNKSKIVYENSKEKEDNDLAYFESEINKNLCIDGNLLEENNKIGIYSSKQLDTLFYNIKNGNTYKDKTIILGNNIDLNEGKYIIGENGDVQFKEEAKKFEPIGDIDSPFEGTFDGNGFLILGLYIDNDKDNQGFIGYNKGIIKNIGIKYGSVKANNYVGALAGTNEGNIMNCFSNIKVEGQTSVGGIIGKNDGAYDVTINQCCNLGNIIGLTSVGGIVGENTNSSRDAINNIVNCYNLGIIKSTGEDTIKPMTGGIVGYNSSNANGNNVIQNCYNIGKINSKYQTDSGRNCWKKCSWNYY